jgi:hypothetical protein
MVRSFGAIATNQRQILALGFLLAVNFIITRFSSFSFLGGLLECILMGEIAALCAWMAFSSISNLKRLIVWVYFWIIVFVFSASANQWTLAASDVQSEINWIQFLATGFPNDLVNFFLFSALVFLVWLNDKCLRSPKPRNPKHGSSIDDFFLLIFGVAMALTLFRSPSHNVIWKGEFWRRWADFYFDSGVILLLATRALQIAAIGFFTARLSQRMDRMSLWTAASLLVTAVLLDLLVGWLFSQELWGLLGWNCIQFLIIVVVATFCNSIFFTSTVSNADFGSE